MVRSHSQNAAYGANQTLWTVPTNGANPSATPLSRPHQPSHRGRAAVETITQPQARAKVPIASQTLLNPMAVTSYAKAS